LNEEAMMRTQLPEPKLERGVMLIEALLAILIFSVGILAVVGMQGVAIKDVAAAKYRSEAGFLANELIAQMWTDKLNVNSTQYSYAGSGSPPARLTDWVNNRVAIRLPGIAAVPPIVNVINDPSGKGGVVTVQMRWQLPEEASKGLPPHSYTVVATVLQN
jgi:type IV pilus assembly protein PilV